jgi:hypothetical protein
VPKAAPVAILLAAIWIGDTADSLSRTLPPELPDRQILSTWEKIEGEVETADVHVVYHFYVNPLRQALYEISHYRRTRIQRLADGTERRVPETEKILWNPPPGRVAEKVRCYERVEAPSEQAGGDHWRTLEPGSAAYRSELNTGMSVFWLHRAALQSRPPDRP